MLFFYLAEFDDKISPSGTISDKRYNPHESLIVNYLENVHEERKLYFEDVSNVGFQDYVWLSSKFATKVTSKGNHSENQIFGYLFGH